MNKSSRLDQVFLISIILKSIDAVAEIIGGVLLLVISPHVLERVTSALTSSTLKHHPNEWWAKYIAHGGYNLAHNSRLFGGLYLLSHGVVKLAVIIGVLKQKLWAYPALIIVFIGFIIYQIWDVLHKFSLGMTLLTVFDSFIVVLTYFEWQKHKRRHAHKAIPDESQKPA